MKTEERTIGTGQAAFRYRMEQVGAETGEQIVLRLSRPLAALFARAAKTGLATVGAEQLLLGISPALNALQPRDLRYLRKKLAEKTTVWLPDGKTLPKPWPLAAHYNEHFAGRYMDAFEWLRWGVTMNCFFGDALERLDAAIAARPPKSSSPLASVGLSGDFSSAATAPQG